MVEYLSKIVYSTISICDEFSLSRYGGSRMPALATRSLGKSSFIKEHLIDNPRSNPAAVNAAWRAAGMDGTISTSLVNKIRADLGLVGNIRSGSKDKPKPSTKKPKGTGKKRMRRADALANVRVKPSDGMGKKRGRMPRAVGAASVSAQATTSLSRQLTDVDAEIDRLLFKVMGIVDLTPVEESLRETRRQLYRVMDRKMS
jgi:hypothetical protein